jgi:nicotinate-nucleotide pyrophosphorylase
MLINFEYRNLKEISKAETKKRALIEKDGNIARKRVKATKSYL